MQIQFVNTDMPIANVHDRAVDLTLCQLGMSETGIDAQAWVFFCSAEDSAFRLNCRKAP